MQQIKKYLYNQNVIENRSNILIEEYGILNAKLFKVCIITDKIKELVNKDRTLLKELSDNPFLTMEYLEENIEDTNWDWSSISVNNSLSMEFLEKHLVLRTPVCKWDWDYISSNTSLTMEFLEKHLVLRTPICEWNWYNISWNPSLTMEFLEKHLDDPICEWDWKGISSNKNLTMKFIEKHLNNTICQWDWYNISWNESITMEFLEKHLSAPICEWNWRFIYRNRNLTMEFLEKHLVLRTPICKLDWDYISRNNSLSMEFLEKHFDKLSKYMMNIIKYNQNIDTHYLMTKINYALPDNFNIDIFSVDLSRVLTVGKKLEKELKEKVLLREEKLKLRYEKFNIINSALSVHPNNEEFMARHIKSMEEQYRK